MTIDVHSVGNGFAKRILHRDTRARPVLRSRAAAQAAAHAEEWLAAWNAHDVEAITNCCADDVVLVASGIATSWSGRHGSLRGRRALGEHLTRQLELTPDLALTKEGVFVTPGGYALLCRREKGDRVIETVELDRNALAARVTVFAESAVA